MSIMLLKSVFSKVSPVHYAAKKQGLSAEPSQPKDLINMKRGVSIAEIMAQASPLETKNHTEYNHCCCDSQDHSQKCCRTSA